MLNTLVELKNLNDRIQTLEQELESAFNRYPNRNFPAKLKPVVDEKLNEYNSLCEKRKAIKTELLKEKQFGSFTDNEIEFMA